jgi:hypothetical protein
MDGVRLQRTGIDHAVVAAVALAVLIANAAAYWTGAGWPGDVGGGIFGVFVIGWLSVPAGFLAALAKSGRLGVRTFTISAPSVTGFVAWFAYAGLRDTSSSTGALTVIWGPIWGICAVLVVWGATCGARSLRARRALRGTASPRT